MKRAREILSGCGLIAVMIAVGVLLALLMVGGWVVAMVGIGLATVETAVVAWAGRFAAGPRKG